MTSTESQDLLARLKQGNQRFCSGAVESAHGVVPARLEAAAGGAGTRLVIVGCADARVPAELIFDLPLGAAFVLRIAGCSFGPMGAATLELAARALRPALVVVLGHTDCLAVRTAVADPVPGDDDPVAPLVRALRPAALEALGAQAYGTEEARMRAAVESATRSIARDLPQRVPGFGRLVEEDGILIQPAIYDLATGRVDWLAE